MTVFPTVLVNVINSSGHFLTLRALVDKCSDASYITEQAVKRLGIPVRQTHIQTTGLGDTPTVLCTGISSFDIQSLVNSAFNKSITAYVLQKISPNRPVRNFQLQESLPSSIMLADPTYDQTSKIDLLLSGAVDALIHKEGVYKAKNSNIVLLETELGWIVSGSIEHLQCFSSVTNTVSNQNSSDKVELLLKQLDNSLKMFWALEELPTKRTISAEEEKCEKFYDETTTRLTSGRYSVRLPFKCEKLQFTNMRQIALRRFIYLEKKLLKNPDLRTQYSECIEEYIKLGHMTPINPLTVDDGYYIPHHCVLKESSTTT